MKRLDLLLLSASAVVFSAPLMGSITPEMMGYEAAEPAGESMEGLDLLGLDGEVVFDEEQFKQILMQLQAQMSPEIQQDIERREAERKELGLRLNTLQNELREFQATKTAIESELSELIDRLAVLMSDQVALDQLVSELAEEIDSLPEVEEEKREEFEQRQADLRELAGEIDLLQEAAEEKRLLEVEMKLKIEAHIAAIAEVSAQMADLEAAPQIDFSAIFGEAADANATEMFEKNIESPEPDPYNLAEEVELEQSADNAVGSMESLDADLEENPLEPDEVEQGPMGVEETSEEL